MERHEELELEVRALRERLSHLFRRFSRADDERGDSHERAGIGLASCKGIVEAHGGRIRAESDGPGLGAKFTPLRSRWLKGRDKDGKTRSPCCRSADAGRFGTGAGI